MKNIFYYVSIAKVKGPLVPFLLDFSESTDTLQNESTSDDNIVHDSQDVTRKLLVYKRKEKHAYSTPSSNLEPDQGLI